jgi:arylsulfatase A-like enzyme
MQLCWLLLLFGAGGWPGVLNAGPASPSLRPNIVFILADDLGWGDVGFNGRRDWHTPNLDRLARQGTTFRRWYTSAVVCAPSRAALLTGRYPIHCGVSSNSQDLPRAETTLAEALRPLGYHSALFGKWHSGQPRGGAVDPVHPLEHGFEQFIGYTNAVHAWQHFPTNLWFGRELRPVHGYSATLLTEQAIGFIRQPRAGPFFLYLAYIEPHLRIEAPPEDMARFRGRFGEKDPNHPVNAGYAAMVTCLDREIGRFLAALDQAGLSRQTLVVFTSDHGATFEPLNQGAAAYHDSNRPFRGHKRTLWEGGIRVPAVVRWPGHIPARKTSSAVMQNIDLFPTLLAAAGGTLDPAWKIDGRNQLDVWRSKETAPERTLFWEWRSEGTLQLAAMRGDLKLVISDQEMLTRIRQSDPRQNGSTVRRPELFNVETDPAERRTLYYENEALGRQLEMELLQWLDSETEASRDRTPAAPATRP